MVKHTRKNKLGGKKMRNKKVSSRKYKKGGTIFGSGREGIQVKLYNRYVPDPFGQKAELKIGDFITTTMNFGDKPKEGLFKFNGYNKNKNKLYVELVAFKMDDNNNYSPVNNPHEQTKSPEDFHEKFYTEGTNKKINLIDPTNITTITTIKVGGKRRTLKALKTLKKSKKVKKSRKNRK